MSSEKSKNLLDQVRDVMRVKHYSIHTERTYCDWIKRFVQYHKITSREDLQNGEEILGSNLELNIYPNGLYFGGCDSHFQLHCN